MQNIIQYYLNVILNYLNIYAKSNNKIFIQIKSQTTFTQSNDNDKLCYGRNNNTNQNQ